MPFFAAARVKKEKKKKKKSISDLARPLVFNHRQHVVKDISTLTRERSTDLHVAHKFH